MAVGRIACWLRVSSKLKNRALSSPGSVPSGSFTFHGWSCDNAPTTAASTLAVLPRIALPETRLTSVGAPAAQRLPRSRTADRPSPVTPVPAQQPGSKRAWSRSTAACLGRLAGGNLPRRSLAAQPEPRAATFGVCQMAAPSAGEENVGDPTATGELPRRRTGRRRKKWTAPTTAAPSRNEHKQRSKPEPGQAAADTSCVGIVLGVMF